MNLKRKYKNIKFLKALLNYYKQDILSIKNILDSLNFICKIKRTDSILINIK